MKTNAIFGALGAAILTAACSLVACASDVTVGSGSGALGGLGEAPKSDGTCDTRLDPCSGVCVALSGDTNNCGTCGTKCSAGDTCSSGVCTTPAPTPPPKPLPDAGTGVDAGGCEFGFERCGGQCIDILFDNDNCNGCGIVCGAGKACTRGICM